MIEYFHISSNESRGEYSFKQVSLWNFDLFFSFSSTLKRLWAKLYFIQFQKINIIPFRGNCWKKLWKLGKIFLFEENTDKELNGTNKLKNECKNIHPWFEKLFFLVSRITSESQALNSVKAHHFLFVSRKRGQKHENTYDSFLLFKVIQNK